MKDHYLHLCMILTAFVVGACALPGSENASIVTNPDVPEGNEHVLEHVTAEVVATFGGDADNLDEVLSGWLSMGVGPEGQIVVLDYQTNQLKSFDAQGTHLWTALGPGQGPGEINNAGQPRFGPDGKIYFPNQGTARLDMVSVDGAFERSIDLATLGMDRPAFQGFLNDSLAMFYKWTRGTYGGTVSTVNFNKDWAVSDTFSVAFEANEPPDPRIITWLEMAAVDGSIVIPNQFAFEQRVYTPDGTLQKTMVRAKEGLSGLKLIETQNGYGQVQYSRQQAPWILDSEWLMVHSRWTVNWEEMIAAMGQPRDENSPQADIRESLDFYTRNWELVWSIDADQQDVLFKGNVYLADGQGHVYTYDSETGMGYKYRVRIR